MSPRNVLSSGPTTVKLDPPVPVKFRAASTTLIGFPVAVPSFSMNSLVTLNVTTLAIVPALLVMMYSSVNVVTAATETVPSLVKVPSTVTLLSATTPPGVLP